MKHLVKRTTIDQALKLSRFLQLLNAIPPNKSHDLFLGSWDNNLGIKEISINYLDPGGDYIMVEYYT